MRDVETRAVPGLGSLAGVIARDANWAIGGGTATIEVVRRALARRAWITDADHQQLFAVSRVTPGTNLLAYCTAGGWHVRGGRGALVALLAASLPSAVMAVAATMVYERLEASATFSVVITAGMTVALLLLAAGAWRLARPHLTRARAARSLAIIAFALGLFALGIAPIWVLLAASVCGALWPASPPAAAGRA